jgi:hypothetical protein
MIRCPFCRQRFQSPRMVSCEPQKHIAYPDGTVLPAIPYDATCLQPYVGLAPPTCRDCGVAYGGTHHPPCCLEDCPRCGGQLLSCACFDTAPEQRYQPSLGPSRGENDLTRALRQPKIRHRIEPEEEDEDVAEAVREAIAMGDRPPPEAISLEEVKAQLLAARKRRGQEDTPGPAGEERDV